MGLNLAFDDLGLWGEYEDGDEGFCLWSNIADDGELRHYLWDSMNCNLTVLDDIA